MHDNSLAVDVKTKLWIVVNLKHRFFQRRQTMCFLELKTSHFMICWCMKLSFSKRFHLIHGFIISLKVLFFQGFETDFSRKTLTVCAFWNFAILRFFTATTFVEFSLKFRAITHHWMWKHILRLFFSQCCTEMTLNSIACIQSSHSVKKAFKLDIRPKHQAALMAARCKVTFPDSFVSCTLPQVKICFQITSLRVLLRTPLLYPTKYHHSQKYISTFKKRQQMWIFFRLDFDVLSFKFCFNKEWCWQFHTKKCFISAWKV